MHDQTLDKPASNVRRRPRRYVLGLAALGAGLLALGLAMIPAVALEQPPLVVEKEPQPPREKHEGGVTLKVKNFQITFGGKRTQEDPPPAANAPPADPRAQLVKWLTVAAMSLALVGLAITPFAWIYEQQRVLPIAATTMCCAAVAWQYIVVGIMLGVAAAIFLIVLLILSTVFS